MNFILPYALSETLTKKLSVLIFSRDDVRDALGLVRDVYGIADEIVIVDSSTERQHKSLLTAKAREHLSKLRVFYVVPLGYPDPLRMYALGKCRNRWVLLIDTDERLSDYAKNSILDWISSTDASAMAIKRYEYVRRVPGRFFTWQVRLFRKDKVRFKGILHEQPEVFGVTNKSNDAFYIKHMTELGRHSSSEYSKISVFERMTYGMFRRRLLGYANKAVLPSKGHINETYVGKSMNVLLNIYQKLKLRGDLDELSRLDYLLFYFLVDSAYRVKDSGFLGLLRPVRLRNDYIKTAMSIPKGISSEDVLEISKIIYDKGIIDFLGLYSEKIIKRINNRYRNRVGGISLLIEMIIARYRKGDRWLSRP